MEQDKGYRHSRSSRLSGSDGSTLKSETFPLNLWDLILRVGGWHQAGLVLLSGLTFAIAVAPLELQRRIINDTLKSHSVQEIMSLVGIYVAIALAGGLTKLILNIYRSWIGENAVRQLRASLLAKINEAIPRSDPVVEGIKVSLVVDEADPIGGFVGSAISEPVLQGGILLSVFSYMTYLHPHLAIITFFAFLPQFFFVPLIQSAINTRVSTRIGMLRKISVGIISGYASEALQTRQEKSLIERVFVLNMGIYKLKFSMNFLMNLVYHLSICAILAAGGYFIVKGETEVGTVVAFLSGLSQINDPWGDLVNWFRDLQVTRTKYSRIVNAVRSLRNGDPVDVLNFMSNDNP